MVNAFVVQIRMTENDSLNWMTEKKWTHNAYTHTREEFQFNGHTSLLTIFEMRVVLSEKENENKRLHQLVNRHKPQFKTLSSYLWKISE